MSSHAHVHVNAPSDPGRLPMTLPLLAEKKRLGEPIVMVTAYDYPSARAAEAAGVVLVLVGDSAATTVLGYNSTTPVELGDMLVLARAARPRTQLVALDDLGEVAAEDAPDLRGPGQRNHLGNSVS